MELLSKERVIFHNNQIYITHKYNKLKVRDILTKKVMHSIVIPPWRIKGIGLLNRLYRMSPYGGIQLDEQNVLFALLGKIYRYNYKKNTIDVEFCFRQGVKKTLYFCKGKDVGGGDCVVFGEYYGNKDRDKVLVYKRDCVGNYSVVYEFDFGTIRHIHNILYDDKRKCYYSFVGDSKVESAMYRASVDFKVVEKLVEERACFAQIVGDKIVFATDTPDIQNHLKTLDLQTKEVCNICELAGAVIYGIKVREKIFFATSVEPSEKIVGTKRRFTKKIAIVQKDHYSHLYCYKNGEVNEIAKFKKDFLPSVLFQFGNIKFSCSGDDCDFVVLSLQSCKPKHGQSYIIK